MASIQYISGSVTEQAFESDYRIIPHIVNNEGKMGDGVALALYKKWPEVKRTYVDHYDQMEGVLELGDIIPVRVENRTVVYNMVAQRGIMRKYHNGVAVGADGKPPIRYAALMQAMNKIRLAAKNVSGTVEFHCPKFGCGLAGGNWDVISCMIEEIWCPLFTVKVCVP